MKKMLSKNLLVPVCMALLLAACENGAPPPAEKEPAPVSQIRPGIWRATLQTAGGELPFLFELGRGEQGWRAWYINGEERMPVPRVTVGADTLELIMPTLDSRLHAQLRPDGSLAGEVVLLASRDPRSLPLTAEHGKQYRFFAMLRPPEIDVSGRWAMRFTGEDGEEHEYVGEFRQTGSQVEGTVLRPSGDMRYLAGAVRGRELYLSSFDGSDARLFEAELSEDGILSGEYWANGSSHMSFTGRRDADAALPDREAMAHVKEQARFAFRLPNLAGETVSLADPRFRDKVVIVTLGGSWCINCHDEAEFLVPWYRENRDRGVEVVQIMFERVASREEALEKVREFRDKFAIPYPVLFAGTGDIGIRDVFPELEGAFAFPTTIFIGRDGTVREVHVGFSGPGTGAHYRALIADFKATVDTLLQEE